MLKIFGVKVDVSTLPSRCHGKGTVVGKAKDSVHDCGRGERRKKRGHLMAVLEVAWATPIRQRYTLMRNICTQR